MMTARDVLLTDATSASLSSGTIVRGSTTSALIPCCASTPAAFRATWTMLDVAIKLTSRPSRFTSATPNGIVYSPCGTIPFQAYIILSSYTITGLSSRTAVLISPLASAGVDGMATLRPGMWDVHACRLCECCAAADLPAPSVARMVSGTFACPPDI